MEITIMTFNLRVDVPSDNENSWKNRADKAAEVIKKHNPSIIGIQEGLSYMLSDIEDRLGNYQYLGRGREVGNKGELSAIFYKKDILNVVNQGQFWLSEQPSVSGSKSWGSDYPRVCTWGHFQFKNYPKKDFFIYNTHLDHISQEAREQGIRMIWGVIGTHQLKERPFFLTGDLNATPENSVITYLKSKEKLVDAYSILEGEIGSTFHSFSGETEGHPIDYIFAAKEVQLHKTIVDRCKINGSFPSDHFPVILKASI
ncbi:endonuclease/exonuclease/phosphatase family protein [Neobacillus sp. YX16]|uniref:endonuclease/exonuclease/phosphatase family protein n=1 Tax=Neobacillus sp. YX16 TaxID=3047874 RepID=UPI0024C2B6DE|nr:endonuclease/exonuclease/phosphatase family protein [Neobacillus sp. YX16]WHZ03953.1 endonuclease/exonuclease/phosphatase family protein [Neobacillus sp. YX16]